ncbi:hypothetical protein Cni_G01718 [Canna indica]|uniref:Branchless trichome n=1 Tax=Canna indica TaxID=4628 RepID=A0AAQ3Q1B2_9LILI|nr:hypothetical protein Cni_G01718 [Canna indica]
MDKDDEALPLPSELELAHAHIKELKGQLEIERRMRCRMESMNKSLNRELIEERRAREAADEIIRRLEEELTVAREEAERARREIEEERRMLQIAELWREERVQIKLVEAKLVMEEKLQEMMKLMATTAAAAASSANSPTKNKDLEIKEMITVNGKSQDGQHGQSRREVENPHIRRGIKGFVEFPKPKVVKTQKSNNNLREGRVESNLECQRAQLRILLRNRNPNGLMGTSPHFVT